MPRNAHQRVEPTPREPACRLPGALSHHFFARRRESGAEKSRSRCANSQTGRPSLRREGRNRWNYLNVAPVKAIYDRWISSYAGEAVDLLWRLKQNLEGT